MATTTASFHVLFRKDSSSSLSHLGRLVDLVPSLQICSGSLDRDVHGLCPILCFLWCTHPDSREPSSNTAQQLAEGTRGMLQLMQAISRAWLPQRVLDLQFANACQQVPENATIPNLNFYMRYLHILMSTFFPVPVMGSVTMRQNTKICLPHPI